MRLAARPFTARLGAGLLPCVRAAVLQSSGVAAGPSSGAAWDFLPDLEENLPRALRTRPRNAVPHRWTNRTQSQRIGSLSEASFDFESDPPCLAVEAAYSKHRRRDLLPRKPELAADPQAWFQERRTAEADRNVIRMTGTPQNARLWPGEWASGRHAAKMMKIGPCRRWRPLL